MTLGSATKQATKCGLTQKRQADSSTGSGMRLMGSEVPIKSSLVILTVQWLKPKLIDKALKGSLGSWV